MRANMLWCLRGLDLNFPEKEDTMAQWCLAIEYSEEAISIQQTTKFNTVNCTEKALSK